ncbi:MAG TPA: tetraacyldisaccharide 4'-kinase [Thermoanaerobaculia bacterium]|nr:tetraacyldisaccharide 4'-kinase [Thermoanaerobaculia bacterium]
MRAIAPVELAIRGVNRARRAAYRRGWLGGRRLSRPVISIGNRSVGGSGKTPATIAFARALLARGLRPAILTRGYGRFSDEQAIRVDTPDPVRFGDEPVVMAISLPGVPIIVGSDRYRSGSDFLRSGECDLFLLDDGFQHLQLERDVDVVIEGGGSAWLREGESALADADVVLHRGGGKTDDERHFAAALSPLGWRAVDAVLPPQAMNGESVLAIAGLAEPRQFFRMVRETGADVRGEIDFGDHHRYVPRDLEAIEGERVRAGASRVVTTLKDAVKTRPLGGEYLVLDVEMRFESEERLIAKIISLAHQNFRDAGGL